MSLDDIAEKSAVRSLGTTKADLDFLHQAAEKERARQVEAGIIQGKERIRRAETLAGKSQEIKQAGKQLSQVLTTLKDNEQRVVPVDGNNFLIIKRFGRDRMAIEVTDDEKTIINREWDYFKDLDSDRLGHVTARQEIRFYDGETENIYVWDKEALDKFSHDRSRWWGTSAMITVKNIDKTSGAEVEESYGNLDKLIPVPPAILPSAASK